MNFSVNLSKDIVEPLDQTVREKGKTRNTLIREAVGEYLDRQRPSKWPVEIMNFRGIRAIKRFEENRKQLNKGVAHPVYWIWRTT